MKDKIYIKVCFLIFFVCGMYFSKDFGISWDESLHRKGGKQNLALIAKTLKIDKVLDIPQNIINPADSSKDIFGYGAAFDTICFLIEKLFRIDDLKNIWLMRHKMNFLIYLIGAYLFFLFSKSIFKNQHFGFIASMFYLLHPRLLSHGFFNGKDSIAQALVACSLFPLFLAYKNNNYKYIIISGAIIGLAITTRIPIIYLPLLFITLLFFKKLILENGQKINSKKIIFIFILSNIFSIYLFWPIIWESPIDNFILIFDKMKNHYWVGSNLYMGEYIKASEIPWHYTPIWILITTPISYLLFFIMGIIKTIFYQSRDNKQQIFFDIFMFFGFVGPLVSIAYLGSTLYDGWRHTFFIYPFLCYYMALGFSWVYSILLKKFPLRLNLIIILLSVFTFIEPSMKILYLHPHQNIYFNSLAGKDPMRNFEGDYWGNSMRQGIEWILNNDKKDGKHEITIASPYNGAKKNYGILTKENRQRVMWIFLKSNNLDNYEAVPLAQNYYLNTLSGKQIKYPFDYFITNFRGDKENYLKSISSNIYLDFNEVYNIKLNQMKILSVYKKTID